VWETPIVAGTRRSYGRRWLDAARHPARRDGAVLWALLVLPWVAGLALTRRHHHLDTGGWAVVLTVSLGLPPLWVTWASFRDARRAGAAERGPGLPRIADELAVAVRAQWDKEVAVRRLNDPYPLPVSWAAVPGDLAAPWESLVELAASGAGWPPPSPERAWAAGPAELAGEGGELAGVLGKVPTGRLVVLGEPGSGKTMLMVRLVLDLLAARAEGGPVPVLFPVASWDPSSQALRDWLATRLITDHPALAGPASAGTARPDRAAALIGAGLILPVLDGLDEIPDSVRGAAVSRINDALRPGGQVLVTCRTRQYQDAVRPPDGPEVTLAGAAAIELRPLDADAVRRYLRDDAPGPAARARWDPVLALLGTQAPAGQALSTPLMVALARIVYNPRPGEAAGALRDPAELCGLPDRAAVEAHLFDAFIPAVYRTPAGGCWTAGEAERWLAFLARHLEQTIGTPDLAWWQLEKAVSRTAVRFVAAAGPELPARGVRMSTAKLVVGFVGGFAIGLWAGLGGGLVFGLGAGLGIGLGGVPRDIAEAIDPRLVLARDRQVMLFLTLGIGLGGGLAFGLVVGLGGALGVGIRLAVELEVGLGLGLVFGFGFGLGGGLENTKWTPYVLARGWLAFRRQLPWPLMAFLADAHQRGVLRQAGATYQFRHLELQHRLATRP
jgi:hypothetical protein